MNKLKVIVGGVFLALLAGCGSDKGMDFVGHWIEVDTMDSKPTTLSISYDGEIFHVDRAGNVVGIDYKDKIDGKAASDSTLSFVGGMEVMRFEHGRIFFEGREFLKSP